MLTFKQLKDINAARNVVLTEVYETEDWVISDWTNALAGEAGEAANFGKKLRRRGIDKVNHEEYKQNLGKELADTVLYADLCASFLGLNLEDLVRKKFNEVSIRHGILDKFKLYHSDKDGIPYTKFEDGVLKYE